MTRSRTILLYVLVSGAYALSTRCLPAGDIDVQPEVHAFLQDCAAKADAARASGRLAVEGGDGWLYLTAELRHMGVGKFWGEDAERASRAVRPDAKDPGPAIADFHEQLEQLGIDLILVPVPPRAVIYADKLSEKAPRDEAGILRRCDPFHQAFYDDLRKKGICVLDLTDDFLAARAADSEEGPVCCRQDTHWSSRGCRIAARRVREIITRNHGCGAEPKITCTVRAEQATITGDLWRLLEKPDLPKEVLQLHKVGVESEADPGSPVLLLADSHGLVFHSGGDMHGEAAGFADHLAAELGFAIDTIGRRGSAATSIRVDLARKFYRDADYRKTKKVIVWCFAAREFTETTGWRQLRITKSTAPSSPSGPTP